MSVRVVEEASERLSIRRGVVQPVALGRDLGAMVTVRVAGGIGYCASADLSPAALAQAARCALHWARQVARSGLLAGIEPDTAHARDVVYRSPVARPLPGRSVLLDLLAAESAAMQAGADIVDSVASVRLIDRRQWLYVDAALVADQRWSWVEPGLEATAGRDGRSQTRSLAGQYNGFCQQGGFEVIARSQLVGAGERLADEARTLLDAPNCPTGTMDLLLMPDQMMLQIHESIGHPLELDRILGDERNFAGTSFVSLDMFGHYRYGSELLDVSFDPGIEGGVDAREFASYAVDDEGTPATRVPLIRAGILERPLGSALSVMRARAAGADAIEGVAAARAAGWHRPPIDRMANLNVEPGHESLASMIARVERGVLMRTNVSWSIDDSRNSFQFGCEWGQLIEDGKLGAVVRDPGYRGVSATFWRSLAGVGDAGTVEVMGTPFCGKGEPGQVIRVGHASPACLFRDVAVFGAEG